MADVASFKGVRYNPEKIKDISKVTAPPYDVISREEQESLYGMEEHNIIHILLGRDMPGDDDNNNKYIRAGKFLKEWQETEVLKKDAEESVYVYLQEFSVEGVTKSRLGFIALLKLEEFDTETSTVYPHENTLSAPKEDRTKLIRSIEANLGPVFALFGDEDKAIDSILKKRTESEPDIDMLDSHGIRNKLWKVSDRDVIEKIIALMKKQKLFIADGHHRYEVGLAFSKLKKDPKYGYILTYFTGLYDEGIVVLPTHRMIGGVRPETLSVLKSGLNKDFKAEDLASKESVKDFLSSAKTGEKKFVLYDKNRFTGLTCHSKDSLDVSVLHDLIVEPLKKRVEKENGEIIIDFTKDLDYAVKEVDEGRFSFCVILNPTKITEIRDIAFAGKRMPQKSTYFYPKVLTGLVINVF
jgi:uncharacterized protein (DUF1015 family)